MNQEKIGKLIAYLRKKQNLTQSELGAKVGVGDRAVSKWERGITCPDISIINDLSKVLGITADELLAGELNDKRELNEIKNNHFNKKLLFIPLIILIAIITTIIIVNHNKTRVYTLRSENEEYTVTGSVIFSYNKVSILINEIILNNKESNDVIIKNYEYFVRCNNDFIIRQGYIMGHDSLPSEMSIGEFVKTLSINYDGKRQLKEKNVVENGLVLTINFFDENDNLINKEIKMVLKN